MRMIVDLPEPDRPMMTKISPRSTVKLASMTAAVPASATSWRDAPARNRATASFGLRPKTLCRLVASSAGPAVSGAPAEVGSDTVHLHCRMHAAASVTPG